MSGRSATTSIARMTGILGAIFIINCLALSIVFNLENQNTSLIDDTNAVAPLTAPIDSPDTTLPLADETIAAETPETETAVEAESEVATEPKDDE